MLPALNPDALPAWVLVPLGILYVCAFLVLMVVSVKLLWRVVRVVLSDTHRDPVMMCCALHRPEARALWRTDRDLRIALWSGIAMIGLDFVFRVLEMIFA